MNWKHSHALLLLLLVAAFLLLLIPHSESKRPGRKKRPPSKVSDSVTGASEQKQQQPRPNKNSGVLSGIFRRNKRVKNNNGSESRKVYYYSLPPRGSSIEEEVPGRIILGDDLNFNKILKETSNNPRSKSVRSLYPASTSSSSSSNHETRVPYSSRNPNVEQYHYHYPPTLHNQPDPYPHHHQPLPILPESSLPVEQHSQSKRPPRGPPPPRRGRKKRKPRRRPGRGKGPGYRLNNPQNYWQDQYVLNHQDAYFHNINDHGGPPQKKPPPPKVMDSMKKAAGELKNAYKAAMIQTSKITHFTTHTASNYIKGLRNMMGGGRDDENYKRTDNKPTTTQVLRIPEDMDNMKVNGVIQEVGDMNEEVASAASSGAASPNVYLDWGGSFWRLFYNKAGEGGGSVGGERKG